MKQYISIKIRLLLSLLFILLSSQHIFADSPDKQETALNQYFNKCASQLHSPDVLKMTDTLYNQASLANNTHYMILARALILEYYYFKGDKEKTIQHVAEVKKMSRKYNDLDRYYFTWGSRLITMYLKNGMPNHALVEAQNMLHEAQKENFEPGIAECYKAMANIHFMQSNTEQAALNYQKLIELVEKITPDEVNLPVYYTSMIENLMQSNQTKEAEKALQKLKVMQNKADSLTAYQKLCIEQSFFRYYLMKENYLLAKNSFEKIERLFTTSEELSIFKVYLYNARLRYYKHTKQYDKALATIDSITENNPTFEMKLTTLSQKGDIFWDTNKRAAAAECYREYISANDSVRKRSMQNSADEIAGILNLRQLEKEKQQLMYDIQDRRLTTTYWAIGTLIIILIAAAIFIIRINQLNHQLKDSKQVVVRQNQELIQSSEELRKAKEQAEEASNMKTHFIQNMTHEVRTPLNSIVGFSQILAEANEEPENEEFASLITTNSSYLLRLFNDVLELSNIDQINQLTYDKSDNINNSCQTAIKEVKSDVKEGVELIFYPSKKDLLIYTNPSYVAQILNCLLHNATKFTENGSISLEYTVSPSEKVIRYSVTDTGRGIPADQHEKAFERFQKLDNFSQGPGLGLSLARAIATKLGGTLFIDASYTTGSRFILTLPFLPV